jgi:hypothetical protein
MATDRNFWGGAVFVVTVVVAGASALPTLLLQPASDPVPSAAVVAPTTVSEPVAVGALESKRPDLPVHHAEAARPHEPAPAEIVAMPPTPEPASNTPEPPPAREPAPAEIVATPTEPASKTPEPPEPAPPSEAANAFPPVQPVGIPDRPVAQVPPQSRASAAPARQAAGKATPDRRASAEDVKKRKRGVRPAVYPIREFLAWRR